MQQLLGEAQRIAYNVQDIQQAFNGRYKGAGLTGTNAQMIANSFRLLAGFLHRQDADVKFAGFGLAYPPRG